MDAAKYNNSRTGYPIYVDIHGIGVILNFNEISLASIIYHEIKSIIKKGVSAKSVILNKKKWFLEDNSK